MDVIRLIERYTVYFLFQQSMIRNKLAWLPSSWKSEQIYDNNIIRKLIPFNS